VCAATSADVPWRLRIMAVPDSSVTAISCGSASLTPGSMVGAASALSTCWLGRLCCTGLSAPDRIAVGRPLLDPTAPVASASGVGGYRNSLTYVMGRSIVVGMPSSCAHTANEQAGLSVVQRTRTQAAQQGGVLPRSCSVGRHEYSSMIVARLSSRGSALMDQHQ
jgi:hypothetical protein